MSAAVIPMIVETTGGLAPHSRRHVSYLSHGPRQRRRGAVDRTQYGTTRISTKSYFTHHTQQIAKAAVMYDARAILKRVTVPRPNEADMRLRAGGDGGARLGMER